MLLLLGWLRQRWWLDFLFLLLFGVCAEQELEFVPELSLELYLLLLFWLFIGGRALLSLQFLHRNFDCLLFFLLLALLQLILGEALVLQLIVSALPALLVKFCGFCAERSGEFEAVVAGSLEGGELLAGIGRKRVGIGACLVRAHHVILVSFEVEYLRPPLFAVHIETNLDLLLAGDLGRLKGGFLRVGRGGVLATEVVVGLALGDKGLLEGTLLAGLLLLLEEHRHVVPFLLGLPRELVRGVNTRLAGLGLGAKLMDLFRWRLVCFDDMVVSDIADVVIDVVVDDGDIVPVRLYLFLLLPLVVDVGDVEVGGLVALPQGLAACFWGVEVVDGRGKVGGCLEAVHEGKRLGGFVRFDVGAGERKHFLALLRVALMIFVDFAWSKVHSCLIFSPPAQKIGLARMDIFGNGLVVRSLVVGSARLAAVRELAIPA